MNEILLISLILLIGLFLFNLWQLLFLNESAEEDSIGFKKWRIGLFVLALSTLLALIYFSSAMSLIGEEQTLTDGVDTWSYTNNDYKEAFTFLPLVTAVYSIQWGFLLIQVLQGLKFFGTKRNNGSGRMVARR